MTSARRSGRDRASARRAKPAGLPRPQYLRLASYISMFVLVIVLIGRVRQPGSMSWLLGQSAKATAGESPSGGNPAGEKKSRVPANEKAGMSDKPDAAPAGRVNPEGLVQIGECSEVIPELLTDLVDKTGKRASDNAAVYHLLCVSATTPPDKLRASALKDVFYHQVLASPDRFRGKPILLRGIVKRCFPTELPADRNPHGIGKIYEAWFFSEDQQANPARILFLRPPANFPIGFELNEWVEIPAYFVKLFAFESADQRVRAVPMYVGHEMTRIQSVAKTSPPTTDLVYISLLTGAVLLGGLLLTLSLRRRATIHQPALNRAPVDFDPAQVVDEAAVDHKPNLDFLDQTSDGQPPSDKQV